MHAGAIWHFTYCRKAVHHPSTILFLSDACLPCCKTVVSTKQRTCRRAGCSGAGGYPSAEDACVASPASPSCSCAAGQSLHQACGWAALTTGWPWESPCPQSPQRRPAGRPPLPPWQQPARIYTPDHWKRRGYTPWAARWHQARHPWWQSAAAAGLQAPAAAAGHAAARQGNGQGEMVCYKRLLFANIHSFQQSIGWEPPASHSTRLDNERARSRRRSPCTSLERDLLAPG